MDTENSFGGILFLLVVIVLAAWVLVMGGLSGMQPIQVYRSEPSEPPGRIELSARAVQADVAMPANSNKVQHVYVETAVVEAESTVASLEELEADLRLVLMDAYPDLSPSPWTSTPLPLERLSSIPLSQHAEFDHPERLSVSNILKMLLAGTCSPKRVYLGCDHGCAQYWACRLPGDSMWAVLFIGLRKEMTFMSRLVTDEASLAAAARSHGCAAPMQLP